MVKKQQDDQIENAVALWLNDNDVTPQAINVYKDRGITIIDVVVEAPYTADDIDIIALECALAENDVFDADSDFAVQVYEKEDYDSRMSDGVAEDPDAVGDEDEDDELHIIDLEEDDPYEADEEDEEEDDYDDDDYDNVAVDNYVPSIEDLIEFDRDDY